MTDLSHDAQELVEATRGADTPSPSDRERVKKSVLGRTAAAAAAVSSATGAASAAAGSAASVAPTAAITAAKLHVSVAWIVTSLAVGGTAGVGVVALERTHHTPNPVASAPSASSQRAPRAASTSPPAVDTSAQLEPTTAPLVTPHPILAGPSKPINGAPTPRATLAAEVALLREARDALRDGRPWRAIEVLDEHARQFPSGVLGEERQAVRAIALCQAKPGSISKAGAESFFRSSPDSPLVDRVRAACLNLPEGAER